MSPHEILGIPRNADLETIKRAYRELALQHHPDRGGDARKFVELRKAYEAMLRDLTDGAFSGSPSGSSAGPHPSPAGTVHDEFDEEFLRRFAAEVEGQIDAFLAERRAQQRDRSLAFLPGAALTIACAAAIALVRMVMEATFEVDVLATTFLITLLGLGFAGFLAEVTAALESPGMVYQRTILTLTTIAIGAAVLFPNPKDEVAPMPHVRPGERRK